MSRIDATSVQTWAAISCQRKSRDDKLRVSEQKIKIDVLLERSTNKYEPYKLIRKFIKLLTIGIFLEGHALIKGPRGRSKPYFEENLRRLYM